MPLRVLGVFLAAVTLVTGSCGPPAEPGAPSAPGSEKLVPKKTLTLADSYEPVAITETFLINARATAGNNLRPIVHDGLTRTPELNVDEPMLATELPSIEKGTWKVNSDGSMDTTWHLRPNVRWHDGTPLTSADLVLTFLTSRDAEVAGVLVSAADRLVESVSGPDPLTFVMHWSAPYVEASTRGVGQIVPKHLVEDMYRKDKQGLEKAPLFSTEFIGLGPYRIVRWERGVLFEAGRFDDYYLGRPPIDTIYVRFQSDPNTLVAVALAGAADAVLSASSSGISLDQAMEVRQRWEGTGNRVLTSQSGQVLWAEAQYRAEYARPADTMSNLLVRKALLHAVDRQALSDVMTHGLSPVADSYFLPGEPARADVESWIGKFPYDPTRALQLMAEAGWTRGGDGTLVRTRDGQRM